MGGVDENPCPRPHSDLLLAPRPRPQPRPRPNFFIVVLIVDFIYMRVRFLKGLNLVEESFHLRLHCSVGLIGEYAFGCMLGGGGCAFVFVDLEACHNLIYNDVGVVESKFSNSYTSLSDIKVGLSEVVFEMLPSIVRRSGVFPRTDFIFENSFFL